jgi:G:T-mismatch repair DNA endonuclease (very short patch repair protein)
MENKSQSFNNENTNEFWKNIQTQNSRSTCPMFRSRYASKIWKRDEDRIKAFRDAGYQVEVVWENTKKQFKHVIEC